MGSAASIDRTIDGLQGKLIDRQAAQEIAGGAWSQDLDYAFTKYANEDGEISGEKIRALMNRLADLSKEEPPPKQPSVCPILPSNSFL